MKTENLGLHTWHDFTAKAGERLTLPPLRGAENSSSHEVGLCDVSLADAFKMARDGWQDGARVLSDALDSLPPESDFRPDWACDVAGAFPCIPALVAGDPECMWNQSGSRGYRQVALIVPMSYSGAIDQAHVNIYAQAVAAITRSIEASGVDVAIYSLHHGKNRKYHKAGAHAVVVRQYGEPLDLAKVAFAFHSAFLRRLSWAWRERTQAAISLQLACDGYGAPQDVTAGMVREVCGEVGQNVILPPVNDFFLGNAMHGHHAPALPEVLAKFREVCDAAIAGMAGGAA